MQATYHGASMGNAMTANEPAIVDADSRSLEVRNINFSDLMDALAKGYDDFTAMPSHAVFLCVIYPIIGLMVLRFVSGQSLLPMLVPRSWRIVPGAAFFGSVAPIASRHLLIAPSASSTIAKILPELMNSVSSPKNGRDLCTA